VSVFHLVVLVMAVVVAVTRLLYQLLPWMQEAALRVVWL
jgi:hypothetical protein